MNFFKRQYVLRRYSQPQIIQGYSSIPYEDLTLLMDIQTVEDKAETTPDGRGAVQKLKVFCDAEIMVENQITQQKADRLWFQDKWFECQSSRLSDNTILRHWTATFVQCLDDEDGPNDTEGAVIPENPVNEITEIEVETDAEGGDT